jgi:hypothetical protein
MSDVTYTVFGKVIKNDGKYDIEHRNIPYSLKREYIHTFRLIDQYELPLIEEIDRFIKEKSSEVEQN